MRINVTKPSLPDFNEYTNYLKGIWERNHLTNRGPLVIDLESQLKKFLDVDHLLFVSNGTIAIQIAIKALEMKGEIITTPFSYVATTTSILWENCTPVFVDIDPETFCIDASKIEAAITPKTSGIIATHVYGFPCDVERIDQIAKKHKLKVIYDAAHAFGVNYKGKSILSYGDVSTLSFHATKIFHTVEGGAIVSNDRKMDETIFHYHAFGHIGDDYYRLGVNAKNSEVHAAMGLCNLPGIPGVIDKRRALADRYREELRSLPIEIPQVPSSIDYNYAYFPVLFASEKTLLKVKAHLEQKGIFTRRYFYPSLNNLPYLKDMGACPVSEGISKRVVCLPFYQQLSDSEFSLICSSIKEGMR